MIDHAVPTKESARLLQRIRRKFEIVHQAVPLGPLELPFTRIADPDRVLDDVAAAADLRERLSGRRESDPQHLPYWAELWDSAVGVAAYLAGRTTLGPGVSVLDLGCGMGLTGTTAAAMGCRVMFADMEADALLFARFNGLRFDRLTPVARSRTRDGRPCIAKHLVPTIRARCLNWQRDYLRERFDLILGADILYERKQWEHLEPFWRAHLAPAGRVLIGEPGRPTGDAFPGWITPRGWTFTSREQVVPIREKPIRLFSMQLQS
jgi:predicted nicotinamide N-methyase